MDDTQTRAIEIDGKPAAQRYAEIIGVEIDELEFGKPKGFANSPTAIKVGREYFLKSPWMPLEDGSILFPCLVEEDSELELMKISDMAGSTRDFFNQVPNQVASAQAALLFNCEARAWFAGSTGNLPALAATFSAAPPCVGMNVNFELYCGFSINTTLTSLIFGAS